jgi:cation/acetate symporter
VSSAPVGSSLGQPNAAAITWFFLFAAVTLAITDPLDAVSLGLALMLGTAGLPQILMRFHTVPDARTARTSVSYATAFIGFFYLLTFVLGFGAMVLVGPEAIRAVDKGGNMAAPLLAEALGGTGFLGFIAAVAFATILAVVAGLTLSGAAALSHDVWVNVVRGGRAPEREHLAVARVATILGGTSSVALGIVLKGENVAYMVGLAFAIAASASLPALLLIFLSPTIQVGVLGRASAVFPLRNPGLVSIPLAFAVGMAVSLLAPERDARERFGAMQQRLHLGPETDEA